MNTHSSRRNTISIVSCGTGFSARSYLWGSGFHLGYSLTPCYLQTSKHWHHLEFQAPSAALPTASLSQNLHF